MNKSCLRLYYLITNNFLKSNRHFTKGSIAMLSVKGLKFDNLALRKLPIDSEEKNYVRSVAGACFSKALPTPVENPRLVCASQDALNLLDLNPGEAKTKDFLDHFSGNKILSGSQPSAHCYCGHQFGYFSGQLGDGAAIYLGEILNSTNERWEIQLKGAGPTPYSRQADGRKVLRSSIREFLCSEAMHFLGVPTSRAGSCITSDTYVVRDMFYDGHPKNERCTMVLRIAPTFIRFGSFEIFKTLDQFTGRRGPSVGKTDILKQLTEYCISTFYPEIAAKFENSGELLPEMVKEFYKEVVLQTARLVAHWQCVGFCHGVLNTDNMSIVGITIDYGPYGFLDRYDPDHICNSSDDNGRYTFIKQPEICHWNLQKLAESLQPLLPLSDSLLVLEETYQIEFDHSYLIKMRKKVGLIKLELESDKDLVDTLLETMETTGADFSAVFGLLSQLEVGLQNNQEECQEQWLKKVLSVCITVEELNKSMDKTTNQRDFQTFLLLKRTNPQLLAQLGNSIQSFERMQTIIDKIEKLKNLTPAMKTTRDKLTWQKWIVKYNKRIELEYEGMEGFPLEEFLKKRIDIMNANNPSFILRNYLLQNAIDKAEEGDFSQVEHLLERCKNCYTQEIDFPESEASAKGETCKIESVFQTPPLWAADIRVS